MSRRDDFTSTVDGAAAFERWYGEDLEPDLPGPEELAGLDASVWVDQWARAVEEPEPDPF